MIRGFTLAALDASHGFAKNDVYRALLVVKNDGSILQLGLRDSNTLAAASQIRKDDGVHMAWKKFLLWLLLTSSCLSASAHLSLRTCLLVPPKVQNQGTFYDNC